MACEICKKPYVPATDDDSNEKPHVCNICGKSFSLKIQLKRHVLSHEEDVPYICNICEKHLEQSSYNLRLSKKGTFTCETCGKSFSSKRTLLRHASEHTLENVITCDECGEGFKNVTALKKHAVVHKVKKTSSKNECRKETSEVQHLCNTCGKKFSHLRQLEKHELTHKYQCSTCGENFKSNSLLEVHQVNGTCVSKDIAPMDSSSTNINRDTNSNSDGNKDITPMDSSSTDTTEDHSSNSDGKKHVCSVCNQSFTRKSTLQGHIVSHFVEGHESPVEVEDDSDVDRDFKPNFKAEPIKVESPKRQCLPKLKIRQSFQCDKCEVQCASKKTYERHLLSHETVPEVKKTYACKICNESFDSKENYKKHKLTHGVKNDEQGSGKIYTCQLCHNIFDKKRHLRKHLKCHFNLDPNETSSVSSGDIETTKKPKRIKNLACSFCGKLFAGETCLKKHEAKHKDGDTVSPSKKKKPKPLICEFCNEDFTGRKHVYVKHKLSHTPEVCGICDARFVDRAGLREHCRIHIGTEEGRIFLECSQKALDAKNGVAAHPEPKVEYIYLVLR